MANKKPQLKTAPMVTMYQQGLSTEQIGKHYGIGKSSVAKRFKKAGVVLRKSKDYSGKNRYWLWKGDNYLDPITRKRNQRLHRKWSLGVRTRDSHECQDCGKKDTRLEAHHLVDLRECIDSELEFAISNGITVCSRCHKQRHKQ